MGQGIVDLSEARSGCNRSCPNLGQGTGDLSETRSGCNRSCSSLGLGIVDFSEARSGCNRSCPRVWVRLDLVVIEVAEFRVLLTCLRLGLVVIWFCIVDLS